MREKERASKRERERQREEGRERERAGVRVMTETLGLTFGALTSLTELLTHDNMYLSIPGVLVKGRDQLRVSWARFQ